MKESKQDRETRVIELVETGNIVKSIRRIRAASPGWSDQNWKRAVYHAMLMAGVGDTPSQRVRDALQLP